jgi:hypothetical protein
MNIAGLNKIDLYRHIKTRVCTICVRKKSKIKDEIMRAIFKVIVTTTRFTFNPEMESTRPAMKSINKMRAFAKRNALKKKRKKNT